MNGKHAAAALVGAGVLAGAAMYWLQVYAFYTTLPETTVLRVVTETGQDPLSLSDFEGIDATSSPVRFRACAKLADVTETATAQAPSITPEPLTAPSWFSCFDATALGDAIKRGEAKVYLSEREVHTGVDRLIAVYPDGRAYAWHQLNGTLEK